MPVKFVDDEASGSWDKHSCNDAICRGRYRRTTDRRRAGSEGARCPSFYSEPSRSKLTETNSIGAPEDTLCMDRVYGDRPGVSGQDSWGACNSAQDGGLCFLECANFVHSLSVLLTSLFLTDGLRSNILWAVFRCTVSVCACFDGGKGCRRSEAKSGRGA